MITPTCAAGVEEPAEEPRPPPQTPPVKGREDDREEPPHMALALKLQVELRCLLLPLIILEMFHQSPPASTQGLHLNLGRTTCGLHHLSLQDPSSSWSSTLRTSWSSTLRTLVREVTKNLMASMSKLQRSCGERRTQVCLKETTRNNAVW